MSESRKSNTKDKSHKKVISPEGQIKSFEEIEVSTKTVIAVTNLTIDLDRFFMYVPITDHSPLEKRRGRKKRIVILPPDRNLPLGSIVLAQKQREFRGSYLKGKTKKRTTYFLHSVTIIMSLTDEKFINLKVSGNGKLQITGCKEDSHFTQTVCILYECLKNIESMTGEKIYELRETPNQLRVIYNTVMQNMDFNIGFNICRDKLDNFINKKTKFTSVFESSISTGVNIKIKKEENNTNEILQIVYDIDTKQIEKSYVPYSVYCNLLEDKEKRKEEKKEKHHTFLVFASGSIIMSSRGNDMSRVFTELVKTLLNHKENFEDRTPEWIGIEEVH